MTAACPVTVWPTHIPANRHNVRPCGEPTVTDLCAKHEADRVRLGGRK